MFLSAKVYIAIINEFNIVKSESYNMKWSTSDIPDLSGKIAIVTGANSGTGYEVSKALASKNALVILACRSVEKGEFAAVKIRESYKDAVLNVMHLDLSDLSSIKSFSEEFLRGFKSLDILCNNAGIMATPKRKSKDGFELQFATNHLGHFALTGLVLERLLQTDRSRIVNVSSSAHSRGTIDFDDLMKEKKYSRFSAYAQSKLANLLFTYELQRRLEENGYNIISVGVHPGLTSTNLAPSGLGLERGRTLKSIVGFFSSLIGQGAEMGALPILYAAISLDVNGGDYIGPGGFRGLRGYPKKIESSKNSHDEDTAKKLWETSSELTKIHYNFSKKVSEQIERPS